MELTRWLRVGWMVAILVLSAVVSIRSVLSLANAAKEKVAKKE